MKTMYDQPSGEFRDFPGYSPENDVRTFQQWCERVCEANDNLLDSNDDPTLVKKPQLVSEWEQIK